MSESSWVCYACDGLNDWGEATCKHCGKTLYDVATEFGLTKPTSGRSEIDQLRAENARLKAFIADKIHDATREQMMMEIDYKGVGCE